MTAPNITEMGIIPMLAAVLGGEISEDSGPSERIKSKEKQRGVISSPASRRLFTANSILAEHIGDLVNEHNRLHENKENGEPAKHDCEAFRKTVSRLCARKDLLHSLLWQAITEEHPQVAANNASIRKGWLLVDEDGEWNDIVPVADKSALANNFISRVTAIVCGRRMAVKEDGLDPVAQGEEVVGSLDDERVQTFRSMITEIHDELLSKRLPPGVMDSDSKVIGDMTVNEVNRLCVLAMHYKKLSDLTSSLFWCGVRDAVPAASDLPSIGIRRAWDVVKCVSDETEEGIEMVMTPMGPAIAMKIPIPSDLMRSLAGRSRMDGVN